MLFSLVWLRISRITPLPITIACRQQLKSLVWQALLWKPSKNGDGAKQVRTAEEAIDQARKNAATAQQLLETAEADVQTATEDLSVAVNEQLQGDASDPAMNAPVEQAAEKVEAAIRDRDAKQDAVDAAQ